MKPLPSHILSDTFVKICLKYLPRLYTHQQYAHVHCHIIIAFLQVVVPRPGLEEKQTIMHECKKIFLQESREILRGSPSEAKVYKKCTVECAVSAFPPCKIHPCFWRAETRQRARGHVKTPKPRIVMHCGCNDAMSSCQETASQPETSIQTYF